MDHQAQGVLTPAYSFTDTLCISRHYHYVHRGRLVHQVSLCFKMISQVGFSVVSMQTVQQASADSSPRQHGIVDGVLNILAGLKLFRMFRKDMHIDFIVLCFKGLPDFLDSVRSPL